MYRVVNEADVSRAIKVNDKQVEEAVVLLMQVCLKPKWPQWDRKKLERKISMLLAQRQSNTWEH